MAHPENGFCDVRLLFERLENVYSDLHVVAASIGERKSSKGKHEERNVSDG